MKPRACQKLGIGPGVSGKCPAPGQCNICKCPTPGLTRRANAPQLPGGGGDWAQVELTDALPEKAKNIIKYS